MLSNYDRLAQTFLTVLIPLFMRSLTITACDFVERPFSQACPLLPSLDHGPRRTLLVLHTFLLFESVISLPLRLGNVGKEDGDLGPIFSPGNGEAFVMLLTFHVEFHVWVSV